MNFQRGKILRYFLSLALMLFLTACQTSEPVKLSFKTPDSSSTPVMISIEQAQKIDAEQSEVQYLLASGDTVRIEHHLTPTLSGRQVISPDGDISLGLLGDIRVEGLTREQAQAEVRRRYTRIYRYPVISLAIEEYASFRFTVLGRVEKPGVQRFNYAPHLLEVLANAGSMPILDKQATLTQCAIIRDNKQMIWVDLKALLNGNMAFNLKMKRGDMIFIPDSSETSIYVMGQVLRPSAYRLTPRMTLLDAIAQAGGASEDASNGEIMVYRPGLDRVMKVSMQDLIKNAQSLNYELQDRDVIYVEKKSLANLGYVLKQIAPGLSVLSFMATMNLISK